MLLPSLQKSSLPMGSCFGIPIKLHILFPVFLVIQVLLRIPQGAMEIPFNLILLGPFLLLTILLHEFGHCLAARWVGSEVHGILLWPLGGLAFVGHSSSPKTDLLIAIAGPLTHLPQIVMWILILWGVSGSTNLSLSSGRIEHHFFEALLAAFVIINIVILIFNLFIPAYPLDGGRIVADSLLLMGIPETTCGKIMAGLSLPLALGIIIYGFVTFSPVSVLVGLWILYSAWGLFSSVMEGTVSQHPLFIFTDDIEVDLYNKDNTAQHPGT